MFSITGLALNNPYPPIWRVIGGVIVILTGSSLLDDPDPMHCQLCADTYATCNAQSNFYGDLCYRVESYCTMCTEVTAAWPCD